ncbi:MAG: electron transport protein SCO1/SenC [Acidobacteriaceae bacterium]|nr:electron transport protein SCO1/SenC [Acidobacteriaceae bacterium]
MPRKLLFALTFALALSGCRSATPPAAQTPVATDPVAPVKTYAIKGKIVSVTGSDVMLDHEAIPGFMGAMTMSYKLKDPTIVSELHPGDRITATLLVTKDPDGFNTVLLDKIVVIAQAKPDYKPAVQYHVPAAGEAVPDFKLVNQGARAIHLAQFQGKVLLVTFIYTRCPLADFCPRMSRNFADVDKALAADPALYAGTHLLSISFDPAYDTPAVLRSYGEAYTHNANSPKKRDIFQHWDFAVPGEKDLAAVTQFFNVGVTPGDEKSINHSLSTVLIGKDGKIAAWYPSNDWQPAEVVAKIKLAAA